MLSRRGPIQEVGPRQIPLSRSIDPWARDDGPDFYRSPLFPVGLDKETGQREWAWPAMIADPVRAWMRAMDAIRAGQQPRVDDALQVSLGSLGGSSGVGMATRAGVGAKAAEVAAPQSESMASRVLSLYNPPSKPQRPFAADYPTGAPTDATGKLLADIEGRPLVAQTVVGRQVSGAGDRALSPEQVVALGKALTGRDPRGVGASALEADVGAARFVPNRETGRLDREILYRLGLSAGATSKILGHETGHVIDDIAGVIPTAGLVRDLDRVYSTLAEGRLRPSNLTRPSLTRPRDFGYSPADAPRELMAEAIRAYMTDPNYLKTVAPDVAARIRGGVNSHPELSPIIQFNGVGPMPFDPLSLIVPRPDNP